MYRVIAVTFCLLMVLGCGNQQADTTDSSSATSEMPSNDPVSTDWISLFDGSTTEGWHSYGKEGIGSSWIAKDGELSLEVEEGDDGRTQSIDGGDIVTDAEYENFHFSTEWKISACGNSGIMFNVKESDEYEKTYHTGPEMQVLDNTCHPDAEIHTHRAGDLYDMIACSTETVKPAGEWNLAEIIINQGKAQFLLNGEKVVEFTMFDQSWTDMIAKSKFKDMPGFGKARKGRIALQDHDNAVSYRNIKIKVL